MMLYGTQAPERLDCLGLVSHGFAAGLRLVGPTSPRRPEVRGPELRCVDLLGLYRGGMISRRLTCTEPPPSPLAVVAARCCLSVNCGMRIDYVLATASVPVRDAYVDREARKGKGPSDHCPVVVDTDL